VLDAQLGTHYVCKLVRITSQCLCNGRILCRDKQDEQASMLPTAKPTMTLLRFVIVQEIASGRLVDSGSMEEKEKVVFTELDQAEIDCNLH
jgi:hypothetical protein